MRHQKRIGDDDHHDRASHEEIEHDYEEVVDQEEDGHRRLAVCFSSSITVSYSVTARFAAPGREAQRFGKGAPDR